MNRKSFMAELRSLLAFLDTDERDRVIRRYEKMFDEAGEDGEATVVRCFGSPVRQVLLIEREYREATAKGEIPFADGEEENIASDSAAEVPEVEPYYEEESIPASEKAAQTEETAAEENIIGEVPEEEPAKEPAEETSPLQVTENELPNEPDKAAESASPATSTEDTLFANLPELDLSDLDLSTLDFQLPGESVAADTDTADLSEEAPVAAEPAEEAKETETAEPLPIAETAEDAAADGNASEKTDTALDEAAPETTEMPDEQANPADTDETVSEQGKSGTYEYEEIFEAAQTNYEEPSVESGAVPEKSENSAEAEFSAETEPESEKSADTDDHPKASAGRVTAAVFLTIPMILLWAVLFGLSVGVGVIIFAVGALCGVGGIYIAGYAFGTAISYMPDVLLTAGGMLVLLALAVLLLWTGIWIAVTGCTLTVRLSGKIYHSVLYSNTEENDHE